MHRSLFRRLLQKLQNVPAEVKGGECAFQLRGQIKLHNRRSGLPPGPGAITWVQWTFVIFLSVQTIAENLEARATQPLLSRKGATTWWHRQLPHCSSLVCRSAARVEDVPLSRT